MKDINQIKVGDILSESSHYIVSNLTGGSAFLTHYESGEQVVIANSYVAGFINSADEVVEEIKVTKEDKKDGTLGIRSIFESIHSAQVFTVCFKKQDKSKSKKALNSELDSRVDEFVKAVDKAKTQKKGVAELAKKYFEDFIHNPILPFEEGEDRILRGFKVQFESRDGRYDCIDMDIERTDKESGIRPVNINTIKWLIFNGVKYIVG